MRRVRATLAATLLLAAGLGLAALFAPLGETVSGRAVAMDGDSLRVDGVEIRLIGIDAPELAQLCGRAGEPWRCGREAKAHLTEAVARRTLTCRVEGRDRYRRRLARCRAEGRDIGAALVEEGWALAYGDYQREEARARAAKRGLWSGEFERPADWRRARTQEADS